MLTCKQAFENNEMFAVVPLKNCPHLSQLRPGDAPKCKQNINFKNVLCFSFFVCLFGTLVNWLHMLLYYFLFSF